MTPQIDSSAMDADLARSGLTASDMDATADPPNLFVGPESPSYCLPYYFPNGQVHLRMWRHRVYNPAPGKGKYTQPSRAEIVAAGGEPWEATMPYLNPYVLALGGLTWEALGKTPNKKVLLVEGEKKALSAMKYLKRPAIGFPGAQTAFWRPPAIADPVAPAGAPADEEKAARASARAKAAAARRPFVLHPVLAELLAPGDEVEVVFDADVRTNPEVNQAAGTLRRLLQIHGVTVQFVLLPVLPGGAKLGLDDWLMGIQDKSLATTLFDALDRTNGHGFAAHHQTVYESLGLVMSAKDVPLATLSNIRRIIDGHPDLQNRLWYDEIGNRLYETFLDGTMRQVTDATGIELTRWMQDRLGLNNFTHGIITNEMFATADNPKYTRNRVLDELGPLVWDHTPRNEEMFITAFGAEDTEYTRMLGRMWPLSAIARLMQPGCQVDTMLVLEGDQGIGKSRAMEILGGCGYVALQQKLDNKDFLLAAHSGWIADMVELGAMKWADLETIKGLITTRTDIIRAPYGRAVVDRPRRFIMVGTTNTDDYLRDDSGNRRFWPLKCNGEIKLKWLADNRTQYWAEAMHRYMAGEQWWENFDAPTVAATKAMQASRVPDDPWTDLLGAILGNTTVLRRITYGSSQHYFIAGVELLHALGISPNDMPKYSRRLRAAMRKMREWQEHTFQSTTQTITLTTGGATMRIRGYLNIGPAGPSTGNVVRMPPPTKF